MTDWAGVRQVIGPVALAMLVIMQLAAFSPAAAQTVDGTIAHNHGAATVTPLATDCTGSELDAHDGFQEAPACSSTAFGEIAAQADGAQLLIAKAPRVVRVGDPITLQVSTRNLRRDRFLAAGAGGYYLETSLLNGDGIVRGHFHSSCRMLASRQEAPQPDRAGNGLFVATEDGGGGKTPDATTVTLPGGLPTRGIAQCAVWAGDGSHRIPMMQFANQIPAFDSVRILVVGKDEERDDVDTTPPSSKQSDRPDDGG